MRAEEASRCALLQAAAIYRQNGLHAMDKIFIRELEIDCIIGTKPVERERPQTVVINISLECDLSAAAESDDLNDTINYKKLSDEICEMVSASSFFLLEKLAEQVATICLNTDGVNSVTVSADKPEALPAARTVGVEIVRST